jgi:DNA-binding XRE family transcriptional regulator
LFGRLKIINTYPCVIVGLTVYADFSVMEKQELLLQLALRLKELRKLKNVTQEEVHYATGIHVARIEQGKRDISYTTLLRLAQYFNTDLNAFK